MENNEEYKYLSQRRFHIVIESRGRGKTVSVRRWALKRLLKQIEDYNKEGNI